MTRPAPAALLGAAALAVAGAAAVFAGTGVSVGAPAASRVPQEGRPLRLGPDGRFPASAIPGVARAARADRIGTTSLARALLACPSDTAAMGTWCLDRDVRGTATPGDAARVCVARGGVVPTAARLIGAAPRVRLSSRADDRPSMALTADDGRTDLREQSSTPITSTTGSAAAGSTANPAPATLQVVAVYDNVNRGGFAGAVPTSTAERFRCAYLRRQAGPEPHAAPAVTSVAASPGRRVSVTATSPSAGTVTATASVRTAGRTVVVAYATRGARAGTVRLTLRPTRAGRPVLRRGRTLAVTVRVTHRLATGVLTSAARTERLTIR